MTATSGEAEERARAERIEELERKLAYRARLEALALEISRRFMAVEDAKLDEAIDRTLEDCARFTGAEAAHLIRVSHDGAAFSMANLWRDPSLPAVDPDVHDVPIENMAPSLRAGQLLRVDDVDNLPEGLPVKQILLRYDVRAVAAVPLMVGGRLLGTTGLSRVGRPHVWTEDELLLVRFFADTVAHALARARAASEKAQLEARLQASGRLETVGRLAGGIAHDFNNLLLVILGAAELAALESDDSTRVRLHLTAIRDAGTRASELTRKLLAFGRRQPLNRRNLDLNQLLAELVPILRRLLPETIHIDFSEGRGLPSVYADAGQLEQVLVNLAANSRDAMAAGGRLTIEAQEVRVDGDRPAGSEVPPGRFVRLAVRDTGVGISRENIDRVFEPFFTTKDVGKGTGLGLATVYGIIQGHGGFIQLHSEVDRGTSVEIYLPVSEASAESVTRQPEERMVGGHETVLVGEDDPHVRGLLHALLTRVGYTVVTAADGSEVLERFAQSPERFDVVLLDVVMPVITGAEVARRLRELRPSLPIVLTSGYSSAVMPEGAKLPGVPLLTKPFEPDALLTTLRRMLAERNG